jgi:hypothetical protein
LQFGLRVADRMASVSFSTALGYRIVGEVPDASIGQLTMLKLPGDEFVFNDTSTPTLRTVLALTSQSPEERADRKPSTRRGLSRARVSASVAATAHGDTDLAHEFES